LDQDTVEENTLQEVGLDIQHVPGERFEVEMEGGAKALLQYHRSRERMVFLHTEVPQAFAGMGVGGKLAKAGLDFARAEGLKVVPRCPYIAAYIEKHPEYQDLVAA
jgi:uncharacterized protein